MNKDLCKVLVKHAKELESFNEDFVNFIARYSYNEKLLSLVRNNERSQKDEDLEQKNEATDYQDGELTLNEQVDQYIDTNTGKTVEEIPSYIYITDEQFQKVGSVDDYHTVNKIFLRNEKRKQP